MNETARNIAAGGLDIARIRQDFPIMAETIRGKRLVYLDNAASAQKPQAMIDAMAHCYGHEYANIHRGVHYLSEQLTTRYEAVREQVRDFIGAADKREIVFTRGTTEAINLVAYSFLRPRLGPDDEILITGMEHHSNIVPWQLLGEETGAKLRVVPVSDSGEIDVQTLADMIGPRTKLVGLVHVSNALGTINPVKEVVDIAHARGVPVLLDGAQAVPHMNVDVQALDCDFYAFSGHKVYGPSGIGVLYGKFDHLSVMPPWQGGGDMIRSVSFEKTEFAEPPQRFEAGTPNIVGVIGLGAAIEYVRSIDLDKVFAHEHTLTEHAMDVLRGIGGVRLIGTAAQKAGVVSFVMDEAHPHDIGAILDQAGVAIRAGHHCTQPLMTRYGVPATARASFAMYNDHDDVEALVEGLYKVKKLFGI